MRRIAVWVLFSAPLFAQAATKIPPDLRFEVASLKPSEAGGRGGGIRPAPGGMRYLANNCPIKTMIQVAYRVKAEQIVGGPSWSIPIYSTWTRKRKSLQMPTSCMSC